MPKQESPSTELLAPQEVAEVLMGRGGVEVIESGDVQEDIVRRVLASESAEQAFAQAETVKARDLDGVLITVHGVTWAKSAFPEGPAVYALLEVSRNGGDYHEVCSMGGRSLMAGFLWCQINDYWPVRGTLRERPSRTNPERSFWTFEIAPKG